MAKFQLTIASTYVPDWGVYEGIREIIQNGLDGQQDGHELDVTYRSGRLIVTSKGVKLNRNVWLMGTSSKSSGDYRGQFGEGLKLGALALVRAGRKVTIINDDESWNASLEPSEAFGTDVLTVSTRQRGQGRGEFRVEIELTPEEWSEHQKSFLAITPPDPDLVVRTSACELILDPTLQGRCYIKDILVETKQDLAAAYNFRYAQTDRDRSMIRSFDFEYYAAGVWCDAVRQGSVTPAGLLDFMAGPWKDNAGLSRHSVPHDVLDAAAAEFKLRHGEAAVPVSDQAGVALAGHLGRVGIISSPVVCGFFSSWEDLDLERIRSQRRTDVTTTYAMDDLTLAERAILRTGVAMVDNAGRDLDFASLRDRLEIVDFNDGDIAGTHSFSLEKERFLVRVARRQLRSLESLLRVLVHEVAHDCGGDGDVRHERAEGILFSRIAVQALEASLARTAMSDIQPALTLRD